MTKTNPVWKIGSLEHVALLHEWNRAWREREVEALTIGDSKQATFAREVQESNLELIRKYTAGS